MSTEGGYKCIEGFCGPGGMSLGLREAGLMPVLAFDLNAKAIETYRKNLGSHGRVLDAASVAGEELLDDSGIAVGHLDLFAGGPPCQGFSKQKRGAHLGDQRNALVLEFLRLAGELRPRAFLLENVAQVAQARGRHLVREFGRLDYELAERFYVAADYGVA